MKVSLPASLPMPVKKEDVDPQVRKAAEGIEAMFLDYMFKAMRETVPKEGMDLESPATEIFRSMQDSRIAEQTAAGKGVGLADQLVAHLVPNGYSYSRPVGGSNEDQSN